MLLRCWRRLGPALALFLCPLLHGAEPNPYARWTNGLPANPEFFPIAVWLQNPKNADRYKTAGINLYVGLWRGPTDAQLADLEKAGMPVICAQNSRGLERKEKRIIVGWMHNDEPDNAQSLGNDKGYGPPVLPEKIVTDYQRMQAADPTRPILLNLGQGVAWDNWIGRGVRRRHPEDYPEYVQGCDIASFDIYPAVHDSPEVSGKLEFVAHGVERLMKWTEGAKMVWNCIECSRIGNPDTKPTPEQIRAEVWMSLIHGSRGLIYFVHQFKPTFSEASLLDDAELLKAVTGINSRIRSLAPVLNSTSGPPHLVESIATLTRRHQGVSYLFAVNMRGEACHGTFPMPEASADSVAEVLDEDRTVPVLNRVLSDNFEPYEVHLYRIKRP